MKETVKTFGGLVVLAAVHVGIPLLLHVLCPDMPFTYSLAELLDETGSF